MKCPVCTDVALSISSREGVEIDFCPECRGVWLDRGELDKVIERAQPAEPARPVRAAEPERPRSYDGDRRSDSRGSDSRGYDDRSYDKRKKKRSFLEDIFDFD